MKTFHTLSFVISIVLALIFSAGFSSPVLADEAPPITEQEPSVVLDETPPPSEGEVDSANSNQAPTQTEDAFPTSAESETPSVAEVIESLPKDITLVVIDENGEALPLASEEAAAIIEIADPQWCPVGVTPGSPTCSGVKTSFNGTDPNLNLLEWLRDNPPNKAGVIWIEAGYVGTLGLEGGPIILDGTNPDYVGMSAYALTINGGWAGGTSKALNPNTPSTFEVPFQIINWNAPITINNITIQNAPISLETYHALNVNTTGAIVLNNVDVEGNNTNGAFLSNGLSASVTVNDSTFNNNIGQFATGLTISSNGSIVLKNITASGNTKMGASITNEWGTSKPVTLAGDNEFSLNGNGGLAITSNGAITINNIIAHGNLFSGAIISNDWAPTAVPITLTGSGSFSHNGNLGVSINSKGNITLKNVIASFNGKDGMVVGSIGNITLSNVIATDNIQGTGAYVDNCTYHSSSGYCISSVSRNITINGTNNFSNNGSDGLRVFSSGTITVSNVTANNNGTYANRLGVTFPNPDDYDAYGKGVFLHNYGASTAKPITITGTNTFNGNASTGLFVYSYGAIKANNITANDNGCDTKDTDPNFCAGAYLDGNGVTLTGYSYFIDNARDGLIAYSYNVPISLSNLYAKGNDEAGVVVSAAAAINILGTNTFLENNEAGLAVYSTGIVTLNNLTANGNGFEGVYVDNSYATKPMAVIIKGTSTFNGNNNGLYIESYGAITTNGITALYNDYGVVLNNCLHNSGACTAYSPQSITMNGYNNISYNNENGLEVRSAGFITVNNITADFNLGGFGAYLDNWWDGAKGGITIKGYGIFSNNGDFYGLTVWSTGAVTLTNLTANGNARSGVVVLNNYDELKPANVTITGTNTFNLNDWSGLEIFTFGAVTLSNLTANQNNGTHPSDDDFGVFIDNATNAIFARPVTLNGTNTFNNNIGGGLSIISLGAIKVNNVMANGNQEGDGIKLNNQFDLFTSPVTISGYGVFNQNSSSGLLIYSNGMVTLANLTANQNMGFGVSIDNYYNAQTTPTVNVTVTGSNFFTNNGQSGLRITTDGIITINNITANNNGEYGADLNNSSYANGAVKNIVLSGSNMFNNNILTGLTFSASGAVTLTRITANYNNDTVIGPQLSAGVQGIAGGTITFTCGSLYNNEGNGYNLTGTVITLSGVYASGTNSHVGTLKLTRACLLP
ncbi:MAG: right-handed parallel beta-helix repeat-containing protein [Anaerolineales bacterium]|nr:right-handed parallel beta-helix repeat-containing protein [Anaerolineales bacterium]